MDQTQTDSLTPLFLAVGGLTDRHHGRAYRLYLRSAQAGGGCHTNIVCADWAHVLAMHPWLKTRCSNVALRRPAHLENLVSHDDWQGIFQEGGPCASLKKRVIAIALVRRGKYTDSNLQVLSEEEQALHAYFAFCRGLAFLEITDVAALLDPMEAAAKAGAESIKLFETSQHRQDCLLQIAVTNGNQTVAEWLRRRGVISNWTMPNIPVFRVPALFALLVSVGQWRSLPWFPSWRANVQLWEGFPPHRLRYQQAIQHLVTPISAASNSKVIDSLLDPQKFLNLANLLVRSQNAPCLAQLCCLCLLFKPENPDRPSKSG